MAPSPPGDPHPVAGAARGSARSPPRAPAPQMPAIAVLAAAAAWCFLQVHSRRLEALAGRVGPNGNFLDNDQWLSTVSQYDRDKYWNRFRDVSTGGGRLREGSGAGGGRCGPPGAACRSWLRGRLARELSRGTWEACASLPATCSPGVGMCGTGGGDQTERGMNREQRQREAPAASEFSKG